MSAVHAFVAEVFGEFIHTLESSDNETLQIKFIGYAEIQRDIKRVVMRDEGTRGGTAGVSTAESESRPLCN